MIATAGEHGCGATWTAGAPAHAVAPGDVVDTTGAGDAFCGALAAALAWGADRSAALEAALAAGAAAVRHAGASACRVQLDAGAQLTIEVTDDGTGLPETPRPGTGLESMRERAAELGGELSIETRPEGGTRVLARLPLGTLSLT